MSKSRHIYIERQLLNSLAFIKLPGTAAKVLFWFLARRQNKTLDAVPGSFMKAKEFNNWRSNTTTVLLRLLDLLIFYLYKA